MIDPRKHMSYMMTSTSTLQMFLEEKKKLLENPDEITKHAKVDVLKVIEEEIEDIQQIIGERTLTHLVKNGDFNASE